jgi:selenocysteine lyase/cysteine desulfurase
MGSRDTVDVDRDQDFWGFVRTQIIGAAAVIETPFGSRQLTYADYTASGRGVAFIEDHIRSALEFYGNTHTEDDATGTATTERLERAQATIKKLVHADEPYKIVTIGAGSTAAVHRLQQILGVYLPPAGKEDLRAQLAGYFSRAEQGEFVSYLKKRRPIVFVGPYEHHSNEVSWRECWVDVVEIDLSPTGLIDLEDLEAKVSSDQYRDRVKIGAFSAASNVSGVVTPVHEVARILHRHDAYAFFDFAAIAPYVEMDVHRDDETYFDAIYFSPHKFLGGPGSSGVLIFHERLYRGDLAPTVSGGGTVNYVWGDGQDYVRDIETREKAGTPGILQTLRASLAMELKQRLGVDRIGKREDEFMRRAIATLDVHPAVDIIGPKDIETRMAIVSFNIRVEKSYLHPRFVTVLLNDLFGIQSRAGCSCAGPYGHRLLHLDDVQTDALRQRIATGVVGLRPGWVRVNFHYLMTDEEFDFLCGAILFVADHGRDFLPLYEFDVRSGGWQYRGAPGGDPDKLFGLDAALADTTDTPVMAPPSGTPAELHAEYLSEAAALAEQLRSTHGAVRLKTTERDLIPFVYI